MTDQFIVSLWTVSYTHLDVYKRQILGIIGTFLFFMSLTGFLLKLVQSSKRYYFKKLNMFLLRQINSKINTNFISMSFICLMLFLAICTLSGGLGINFAVSSQGKELTPHDAVSYTHLL